MSCTLNDFFLLLRRDVFDSASWDTGIKTSRFQDGACKHKGTGSHYTSCAYDGIIEDSGVHADKATVFDNGAVNNGIMSHGDIVTDSCYGGMRRVIVEGMDDGTILDIGTVADTDTVHIAAQYRTVPNTAIVPYFDITDYDSSFGEEGIFTNFRGFATYIFYYSHFRIK